MARSWIWVVLLVAVVLAIFLGRGTELPAQGPKAPPGKGPMMPPPPKVLVTAARADVVAEPRSFVGTVEPIRRSLVGSAAPGRVEEYLVNEGDAVKAGQPIAILRRGIIQAELDAAKGQLAVRQAELAEMEKSYQEEMEQAAARLMNAQAQLSYRNAKLERSRSLGSAVSRELFEEDSALAAQASANVREAQAAYRMFTGGVRQMKTEQARAWVEAQTAEVQRLTEQFDRHTMKAPFDGWISAEHTEIGQWVMQGDPVAEVVELKEVDIEINVVEDYVANLNTSVEAAIEVPALAPQRFTGRVAIINPQADARARTFPVKVRVQNPIVDGLPLLKSGMYARVTMAVGKPTPCVLVPKDAVVLGGPTPMVFVAAKAGANSVVRPVPVTIGVPSGAWIAAIGELKEGDQVIVEGNERVQPGQPVRPETKEVAYP